MVVETRDFDNRLGSPADTILLSDFFHRIIKMRSLYPIS